MEEACSLKLAKEKEQKSGQNTHNSPKASQNPTTWNTQQQSPWSQAVS